jgi:hypothetical protein
MDDLIAQGDQGAFTFGEFAKNAPAVFSAYSAIGTTPEHIRKANAAMQILMAGTKSADIAVTALNSTMNEMSDPDKQNKLRMMGINVRDMATGEFRDFNDIMFDIVARAKEMGNADYFGTIFGNFSMNAIRAYMTQGERMYDSLVNLGDTAGLLEQKSATMANTLKSNFQNLQTAFLAFADKNLTGPLQDLTNLLNKLAEDPEKIEAAIRGIALAIGAIAAVRIGAGIVSFIANLTRIKSGGGLDVSSLTNTGAGIPVYVTNLGGTASLPVGSMGLPGMQPRSGLVDQYGNPLSSPTNTSPVPNKSSNPLENSRAAVSNLTAKHYIGSAATAGIGAAIIEIPQMINELHGIDQDDTLTNQERGEAKGGAIGDAAGSIIGAAAGGAAGIAAGAAVGAAVGSVVPILGTAVGALVGAGIGALGMWLGGKAGRAVGTAIGGAVAGDDETAAQSPETIYNNSVVANPEIVNNTTLPRGQYSDDYIYTPPDSASPFSAGISNLNNWYQTTQGTPSIVQYNNTTTCPQAVNDLIITPQGQFNTHPDDYIFAMKDPATLLNSEIRNEVRTVEHIPPAIPPVVVEGEIELRSELTIDDKSYRLKQSAGKNTTPYKFAVGNATTARLIQ